MGTKQRRKIMRLSRETAHMRLFANRARENLSLHKGEVGRLDNLLKGFMKITTAYKAHPEGVRISVQLEIDRLIVQTAMQQPARTGALVTHLARSLVDQLADQLGREVTPETLQLKQGTAFKRRRRTTDPG